MHLIFLFLSRESLIRTAFQCLQLVVTDFLPTMPCTCLQIVVDVAGSFGLQNQELNISLTSIGLLVSGKEAFCFNILVIKLLSYSGHNASQGAIAPLSSNHCGGEVSRVSSRIFILRSSEMRIWVYKKTKQVFIQRKCKIHGSLN